MKKTQKQTREKKVVFNEKIDSSINGFSLVIAFIIVGILLQFDTSFFGNATGIIKIIFILIGILGLFTEISNLNLKFGIKGLGNIVLGFFLLVVSYLLKIYVDVDKLYWITPIYQTGLFFIILISIYGFSRGIIEMLYSIYINYKDKNKENKKGKLFSSIIIILTQLFGLLLIIAQIYAVFK